MTPVERLAGDDRKRQIVEAAMPVFASLGFSAATTRELAKAAGISEALLYKHFPSKEHLYRELDQLCAAETMTVGDRLVAQGPSTRTMVLATYFLARIILKGAPGKEEHQAMLKRLMVRSLLEDGHFARMFLEHRIVPFLPAIEACIRAAEASGDVVLGKASARARALLSHHLMVALTLFLLPPDPVVPYGLEGEALLEEAVRFALRGLGMSPRAIDANFDPVLCRKWFLSSFKGE